MITHTVDQFSRTLTGGDRDAIARHYKATFTQLAARANDGTDHFTGLEALAFIDIMRQGNKAVDAFQVAHNLTTDELSEYFAKDSVEETEIDQEVQHEAATELARWCLATGRTAAEYRELDQITRDAFVEQAIALGIVKEG